MKNPAKKLGALRRGCADADFDYVDKLDTNELEWLAQFGAEYYNGNRFESQIHNRDQMRAVWRRRKRLENDILYRESRQKPPTPPPADS